MGETVNFKKNYNPTSTLSTTTLATNTQFPTPENTAHPSMGHAAIADTGASGHYLAIKDSEALQDTYPVAPLIVSLPDGTTVSSIQAGLLDIPCLPPEARIAHVFPSLTKSLLSISTICDKAGLTATYNSQHVYLLDSNNRCVLRGDRCPSTGLWIIDLTAASTQGTPTAASSPTAAPAIQGMQIGTTLMSPGMPLAATISPAPHRTTQRNLVAFYHATMGSPPLRTLLTALDRGYIQLPGIHAKTVRKYPPPTTATAIGHLDLVRQGLRSTKMHNQDQDPEQLTTNAIQKFDMELDHYDDAHPTNQLMAPTQRVLTKVVAFPTRTQQNHTDLTGRFPCKSLSGNEYCLVMYSEDANYIHAEPMKSRRAQDYVTAYKRGIDMFTNAGFKPRLERLDNETSTDSEVFKAFCAGNQITVNYVPPGNHRANKAERAIRTFKNHMIATLATADPDFPLAAWDELLPHALLTLNLIRSSGLTPYISAWTQLHGPYNYSINPIAPAGAKVTIHERPHQRGSWAPHGVKGFYLAPAMQHYRSYKCLVQKTQATRITDTLEWHFHDVVLPVPTAMDIATSSIDLLVAALKDLDRHTALTVKQRQLITAVTAPLTVHLLELSKILLAGTTTNDKESGETTHPAEIQRVDKDSHNPPSTVGEPTADIPRPPECENGHIPSIRVQPGQPQNEPASPTPLLPPPGLSAPPSFITRAGRETRKTPRLVFTAVDLNADTNEPLTYASAMNGPDRALWEQASSVEFERLLDGTQSMRFIPESEKPTHRTASYYNPQVKIKIKQGIKIYRVRGTVGGDKITYPGNVSANAAEMDTIKLLLNAVVSEGANWMTADITDFYLNTPLPRKEYMRIRLDQIPSDIRQKYDVAKAAAGKKSVLVEINKGMYGLPQAGKLAQDRLVEHLGKHGYHRCRNTPCLFRHETRNIAFTLVVDDFGIKFDTSEDAKHLTDVLKKQYEITEDKAGSKYVGISIAHDKQARTLTLSMPKYIENALKRFGITTEMAVHSPAVFVPPAYGKHAPQKATEDDNTPALTPQEAKRVQEIVGVLLYYARAVDPSMLTIVNKVGSMQAKPTRKVQDMAYRLLRYAATWPDAQVVYKASDMRLACYSDASYLSESQARSRAGGYLFLTNRQDRPDPDEDGAPPKPPEAPLINAGIFYISTIIPTVVSSAAEAEYAAMFMVGQAAEGIRSTLEDLGYPQGPTRIISDNACAVGIAHDTVKQKRSKAIDMRYHWIRDRVRMGHFVVDWLPGEQNIADFFTKVYSTRDHLSTRRKLVAYSHADPPTTRQRRPKPK